MHLSFDCSKADTTMIHAIAERAVAFMKRHGHQTDLLEVTMDITAAHCNGCPLNLAKLLAFPDFDFGHDVGGIRRHINRTSGKVGGCFMPRSAMSDAEIASREKAAKVEQLA